MYGIIGRKLGMAQIVLDNGKIIPVTYLLCTPNIVQGLKTLEKDGYEAVVLGAVDKGVHATKTKKFQKVREFHGSPDGIEKGAEVGVSIFSPEERVTVVGVSKGKGFQGRVRRHNVSMLRKTHGTKFRRHGAIGGISITARLQKGVKLPGRMGVEQVTLRDQLVVKVDAERNLLALKGAVPGSVNSFVIVKKTS
jgi:large subunit ribosomal protein L3